MSKTNLHRSLLRAARRPGHGILRAADGALGRRRRERRPGLRAYAAILLDPRYRATLINTVLLAAATTVATLVIATIAASSCSATVFPAARCWSRC